jgi:D-serine deaminase-like pyridoxal phosphate-dependent protein
MERNLQRVQDYATSHNLRLRPHTKTHKIPTLGRRQRELGAVGLTVAKTTEAEVMLTANPGDLLIAYPVYGAAKMHRLSALTRRTPQVTVALDSVEGVEALAAAADELDFRIGVLAEFDAGLHRVGVAPGAGLLGLVRRIASKPRLELRGVAFYPGHIKDMADGLAAMEALDRVVADAVEQVEAAGIAVPVVSGGSTPTLYESHRVSRLNEIRPGTYIFNDRNTWLYGGCTEADCAASILTTVVSTSVPGQMIIDGGSKTFSSDRAVTGDEVYSRR